MAWLLVRAFSDAKDTAWKLGDIVEVRSEKFVDEHEWGKLECLPRFYRIQVSDLDAEKIKSQLEEPDQTIDEQTGEVTQFNRVRKYQVDLSALETAAKSAIERDESITLLNKDVTIKANDGIVISIAVETING